MQIFLLCFWFQGDVFSLPSSMMWTVGFPSMPFISYFFLLYRLFFFLNQKWMLNYQILLMCLLRLSGFFFFVVVYVNPTLHPHLNMMLLLLHVVGFAKFQFGLFWIYVHEDYCSMFSFLVISLSGFGIREHCFL